MTARSGHAMAGTSAAEDLTLLRRFEPVVRYTRGEQFFPMDVAEYVRGCSLWVQRPDAEAFCLIPQGELSLERLAQFQMEGFNAVYFLKYTDPLSAAELAAYKLQQTLPGQDRENVFHAGGGRLARVGYGSRFVDALFSITLLARGRVPGDTAAAATIAYQRLLERREHYRYYGRVVRQGGWLVLQYWFFYLFNNWRTGFFGTNDHEGDWEMVCLYFSRPDGTLQPEWVAYASHDNEGDDLRRHWDDPEVEKVGEHPIVYAGAGSHACYFAPGEYLTELTLPFLRPLAQVAGQFQRFWHRQLRQYHAQTTDAENGAGTNIFRVPFVDYARGDGFSLGPRQDRSWDPPGLLNPPPRWATQYRGLWGFYARDPFSGEDAPAGPMYNRDGSVRRAWYDPAGWAGLDKVTPRDEALAQVVNRQIEITARQATLRDSVAQKTQELVGLGVEATAMQGKPHLYRLNTKHRQRIVDLSKEIDRLRAQLATDQALLEALDSLAGRLRIGQWGPLRAHIRHAHRPAPEAELRFGRLAETWAAASIGLMLLGFVGLVLFSPSFLLLGLAAILSLFVFIEAGFRGNLARLVTSVTVGLAMVATLVILYEFFWQIIVFLVLVAGTYILWENLRELWT